jgi:hypothetical protein
MVVGTPRIKTRIINIKEPIRMALLGTTSGPSSGLAANARRRAIALSFHPMVDVLQFFGLALPLVIPGALLMVGALLLIRWSR